MKGFLWRALIFLLPKKGMSRVTGCLAHLKLPGPLARLSVKAFAAVYGIDAAEAEYPLEHYPSVGDFFIRKLKPGARPIGSGIVHPADALITEAGPIEKGTLIQAKGRVYSVADLLNSERYSPLFNDGHYVTYYLCPTDYHRVHSPVDGAITDVIHIPGRVLPVNPPTVRWIPQLFPRNERAVFLIETAKGPVALVMVAATNVSNMTFDSKPRRIARGDEVGVFNMGSTIVMLYAKGVLPGSPEPLRGLRSRMGASLEV